MAVSLQEKQAAVVQQMLRVDRPPSEAFTHTHTHAHTQAQTNWKLLVYDEHAKDVLAPLMTVGMLRRQGVTLLLDLASERACIVEAPAVYLLRPTLKNVQSLVEDFRRKTYGAYAVNFTNAVPHELLKLLAKGAAEHGVVGSVLSVVDRFVDFVCLSALEFSLNLPNAFAVTHGNYDDSQIEGLIEQVAQGLFCVIATLGVIPVIRCPAASSSPARMIALKLQELFLSMPPKGHAQIFGHVTSANHPVLILLDREFDLSAILQHTWLYGALMHDLLKFKLNRVTVPAEGQGKPKTFDLENQDRFWQQHAYAPFPQAAAAVSSSLADYNNERAKLNQPEMGASDASTCSLLKAMDSLPEFCGRKRSLDMHTTIATALVEEIKARSLDRFFEIEQQIDEGRESSVVQSVSQMLVDSAPGRLTDKIRLLLCLILARPNCCTTQLEEILRAQGADMRAVAALKHLKSFINLVGDVRRAHQPENPRTLEGLSTRFIDKGRGLLLGVKNLLIRKTSVIAQVVEELIEAKEHPEYIYVDLVRPGGSAYTPQQRQPFKTAIVFVCGGGSFVEAAALRELSAKTQKQIFYGTTDFVSPCDFLESLESIGGT